MDFTAPRFNDPAAARQYLEALRWPNGAACPHCGGADRQSALDGEAHRPGLYFCGHCREQYTVTVGTVFERSKIPLHKWVLATHLICSSKKGMSAHQLHRMLGITYKTAWFMAHRIREAMKSKGGMMGGGGKVVEADETYYGAIKGRARNGMKAKKRYSSDKHKIFALVERDGSTRAFHVANVDGNTLKPILMAQVAKEYVRGEVHTNSIESFFGLLKRGLIGTYHHVSEAYLQRFCEEFAFRHSHHTSLGCSDEQRAASLLKQVGGKRLTYRRTNAAA